MFINGVKRAGQWLAKHALEKEDNANINNLWMGRSLKTVPAVAGLMGLAYLDQSNARNQMIMGDSEMQDIESLPGSRSDLTGYVPDIGSNTNLNATGDLVFALHRIRHGG